MVTETDTTILRLVGMGTPPYSARGISESFAPISQSVQLARTVNGALIDLSASQMRKYAISLTCSDMDPPALGFQWPGALVEIDCITELCHEITTESETQTEVLEREAVPGTIREADGFIFYRPRMQTRIMGFDITTDEWGAAVSWTLVLEEV